MCIPLKIARALRPVVHPAGQIYLFWALLLGACDTTFIYLCRTTVPEVSEEIRKRYFVCIEDDDAEQLQRYIVQYPELLEGVRCGKNGLHLAASQGSRSCIPLLVSALQGQHSTHGQTALQLAVQSGHDDAVELLLGEATVPHKYTGDSALILACQQKNTAAAKMLLGSAKMQNKRGHTALMVSVINGFTDVLQINEFIELQARMQDQCGRTALFYAVEAHSGPFFESLFNLEHDLTDKCGETVFAQSLRYNYALGIEAAIAAKLHCVCNNTGQNGLMQALVMQSYEVACQIATAATYKPDAFGITPLKQMLIQPFDERESDLLMHFIELERTCAVAKLPRPTALQHDTAKLNMLQSAVARGEINVAAISPLDVFLRYNPMHSLGPLSILTKQGYEFRMGSLLANCDAQANIRSILRYLPRNTYALSWTPSALADLVRRNMWEQLDALVEWQQDEQLRQLVEYLKDGGEIDLRRDKDTGLRIVDIYYIDGIQGCRPFDF